LFEPFDGQGTQEHSFLSVLSEKKERLNARGVRQIKQHPVSSARPLVVRPVCQSDSMSPRSCEKCGCTSQFRKQNLIARYGAEIPLLDLLEELVGCHMRGNRACMLRFVDLIQR
jgi:hypothetical protein